jgi:hypothetical protein
MTFKAIARSDNCQRLKIENLLRQTSLADEINFGDFWQSCQSWQFANAKATASIGAA